MQATSDPRPVVVAVDTSESARDAAAWAADLAADWSAPLHLLHVELGDPTDAPLPAQPWLLELESVAERAGATDRRVEVRPGDVIQVVSARAFDARLIVLGSYGDGAWSGMLAGSVALGVLGRARCPVAVVRGSAPRIAPPRGGPVVVGVDGSAASVAALEVAADLAASLGARLVAVEAWSDVAVGPGGTPFRRREAPDELFAEAAAELEASLLPLRERYPDLAVDQVVAEGTPVRVLLDRAAGARMLVVGTRGRTGYTGMLMGSTSNALVEFAPCPVVVVHGTGAAGGRETPGTRAGVRS
ncbi:universal stress protein [Pseudonocardia sp. CA-107938]|uniref:universal stress protein n=1 Tax=Pseudonocardia sp. CA-107938 TaxID=3240021 RepID=UPI003D8F8828